MKFHFFTKIMIGVLATTFIGIAAMLLYAGVNFSEERGKRNKPEIEKTVEEINTEKRKKSFSPWNGSHYGLTMLIKQSMHNPSSYEHISTRHEWDTYEKNSLLVRTSYRGKNVFGALVKNRVVARVDLDGNVTEIVLQE